MKPDAQKIAESILALAGCPNSSEDSIRLATSAIHTALRDVVEECARVAKSQATDRCYEAGDDGFNSACACIAAAIRRMKEGL